MMVVGKSFLTISHIYAANWLHIDWFLLLLFLIIVLLLAYRSLNKLGINLAIFMNIRQPKTNSQLESNVIEIHLISLELCTVPTESLETELQKLFSPMLL